MTVKLCPECHHRPSMRDGDPAYCYCKCHDVADAAPELLAACWNALGLLVRVRDIDIQITDADLNEIQAAIAKAEGRTP